jgi:hypothetical protein
MATTPTTSTTSKTSTQKEIFTTCYTPVQASLSNIYFLNAKHHPDAAKTLTNRPKNSLLLTLVNEYGQERIITAR